MKSFWIYFLILFFSETVFANEKAASENSSTIKNFSYRGISFNVKKENLIENNYICKNEICSKLDLSVDFDHGFLNRSGTVNNGVIVYFYDEIVRRIQIEQLYSYSNENCKNIVSDFKSAFEEKYSTNLSYGRSFSRFGDGLDYSKLNGDFYFGKDKINLDIFCDVVISSKDNSRFFYFKASFNYENMASRFIIDGL